MREIAVTTERRTQLLNITRQVEEALGETDGASAALVYVPHTTAAVTATSDPAKTAEMLYSLLCL